jgi:hypothetical protein
MAKAKRPPLIVRGVTKRFSNGLQFNANYTYSKALDEISDTFTPRGQTLNPTDSGNIGIDYGPADFDVARGRRIYLHVARGALTANGAALETGDALRITDGAHLHLSDAHDAEVLVFDLPGEIR